MTKPRKCGRCKTNVDTDERSLKCCRCKMLLHSDCAKVDRIEYESVSKQPQWCCSSLCKQQLDAASKKNDGGVGDIPENPTNRDLLVAIRDLSKSQQFLGEKYDDVIEKIETIMQQYGEMEKRVTSLEKENDSLKRQLKTQGDSQKQHKGRVSQKELECNAVITGVPNDIEEKEALRKIADKIDETIKVDDCVVKATRLYAVNENGQNAATKIPVVVSFASIDAKAKFLAAFKKKRLLTADECGVSGGDAKIVVMEQLSNYNFQLLKEARKLKEAGTVKFVWFQNSNVLVRKDENARIFRIACNEDLAKFK